MDWLLPLELEDKNLLKQSKSLENATPALAT